VQQAAKHRLVEIEVREPVFETQPHLLRAGLEAGGGESLAGADGAEAVIDFDARGATDAERTGTLGIC
jgi:hypothetical protein